MATKKKLLQAAAGAAGGDALNIEDVFSTYLYTGNDTSTAIDNGVDLAGEGGLVWVKARSTAVEHVLYDTERGALKLLQSNSTAAELTQSTGLSSFNSNGFTTGTNGNINGSPHTYASWTFRKAPKFFDVVTYTGAGSSNVVSHNLNSTPACILIKRTKTVASWMVYHKSLTNPSNYYLSLNLTNAEANWGSTWITVSDTSFTLNGTHGLYNGSGDTYVAYLFAHNDGDGEFGTNADQDIIKCGSYTGNAGTQSIDVGFEPHGRIIKNTDGVTDWSIVDAMRGMPVGENAKRLMANNANAEQEAHKIDITPTGFHFPNEGSDQVNANGNTYIYMAIRRGPMRSLIHI